MTFVTMVTRSIIFASIMALVACAPSPEEAPEALKACLTLAESSDALALVGTEGAEEICSCTVARVQTRYPDADQLWVAYAEEVTNRLERRGMLGMAADTQWMRTRGATMAEFAAAQATHLAGCFQKYVRDSARGDGA